MFFYYISLYGIILIRCSNKPHISLYFIMCEYMFYAKLVIIYIYTCISIYLSIYLSIYFYRIWTLFLYMLLNCVMQAGLILWFGADSSSIGHITSIVALGSVSSNLIYYSLQWLVLDNLITSKTENSDPQVTAAIKSEVLIMKEADALLADLRSYHNRLSPEEQRENKAEWLIYYDDDIPIDRIGDLYSSSITIKPSLLSMILQPKIIMYSPLAEVCSFTRLSLMSRLATLNEYEVEDLHILFKYSDKIDKSFLNQRLLSSIISDLLPSRREEALFRRLVTDQFGAFSHADPRLHRLWYWLVAIVVFAILIGSLLAFSDRTTPRAYKV